MVALPKREPLLRYIEVQQLNDREMRRLLKDAAAEASRVVNRYGTTFSASVRAAQLDLARGQQQLWQAVQSQVTVGIGDAVDGAADSVAYLNELMLNAVGGSSAFWRASLQAQARQGIPNLLSRGANNIPLAESVYKNTALHTGRIDRLINAGIVNGFSAREMAQSVRGYIDPDVVGGVSYAAMRLGRSELNNAFHRTTQRLYADQPWVMRMKWNLSSSHPKPDICNDYANSVHTRNGGPGEYNKEDVPGKPHPQCFCYTTPIIPDDEVIADNFAKGKYDDYIDGMGCGVL